MTVSYGQRLTADLADNSPRDCLLFDQCWDDYWWLPTKAGDKIVVHWQVANPDFGGGLCIIPPPVNGLPEPGGTINRNQSKCLNDVAWYDRSPALARFARSGRAVLDFFSCCNESQTSAYAFTATVQHKVVAELKSRVVAPRGKVKLVVSDFAGKPLSRSLRVRIWGHWRGANRQVGASRSTTRRLKTAIRVHLPRRLRGQWVKLQVRTLASLVASGGVGYQAARSNWQRVRVR